MALFYSIDSIDSNGKYSNMLIFAPSNTQCNKLKAIKFTLCRLDKIAASHSVYSFLRHDVVERMNIVTHKRFYYDHDCKLFFF